MYLIAGLGNPGPKYRNTRHNIGFKIVNFWCRSLNIPIWGKRFQSRNAHMQYRGKDIILVRPMTFMNKSGESIHAFVQFYDVQLEDILIIHDDIDLQVGKIKVVRGGGAGGHKGVLSVTHYLGSNAFPRVKIGVGRPRHGESIEDFVLKPFYGDEKEIVKKVIPMAVQACEMFILKGIESTMNYINFQNLANKEVLS